MKGIDNNPIIVCASNNNYVMMMATMLKSLIKNHKTNERIFFVYN